jgi:ATP-binding cassette subfamily B (MDR/TAP) protein 6
LEPKHIVFATYQVVFDFFQCQLLKIPCFTSRENSKIQQNWLKKIFRFFFVVFFLKTINFYCLTFQVFSHISLIVIAGLDILLRHVLFNREVLGFEILYVVASGITWPMVLGVLVVERCYQLPTPPSHGHGLVPILTWTGAFIAENLAFLSMDNEAWWYHLTTAENKVEFTFWFLRYVFTVMVFILGIKAPGIRRFNAQPLINEDFPENPNSDEVRVSNSDGSTWRNSWKKIRTLLPYMWPKKSIWLQLRVILCIVLLIGVRITNVYVPLFSKKIVDALAVKEFAWGIILGYVGLKLIQGGGIGSQGLLNIMRSFLWIRVAQYTKREIQVSLFSHLHSLSLRWHLSRKTGELLRVMDRGTESVNGLLNYVVFSIVPTLIDIIIAIVFFTTEFNIWFGLIVFITMAIYLTMTIVVTEWRTKFRRSMNKMENEQRTKAVDSLLNFETVKYYTAEEYEINRYDQAILDYQSTEWSVLASLNLLNFSQSFVMNGGLLAGSVLAAYMVSQGTKTVGDYVLFGSYILQLMGPLSFLGTLYRIIQESFINMENMMDLLEEPTEIKDVMNAPDLLATRGKIEFKNVSFYYGIERPILKNVSFVVGPGETCAIVGPTGSGKSTMMRLLFRFFDIQEGVILFDEQNIRNVAQNSLRKHIGVVPQDTVLFNDTIEANIKYARPEASLEEVKIASTLAEIHEQIDRFPEGYDTVVGERGLKLSGGEKQRVAIARTLLKSPLVILLDEATSALDSGTEKQIQSALNHVCSNRTTIVVAHRLSTITNADLILVLKNGEIVERGKHNELLEQQGLYQNLWEQQSNANNQEEQDEKDEKEEGKGDVA